MDDDFMPGGHFSAEVYFEMAKQQKAKAASPEVAPMRPKVKTRAYCHVCGGINPHHGVWCSLRDPDVPAVAPRETQPELDEILRRGAHYSKTLPKEAYGSTNSRPDAPATQHRVVPVEWHRVAVEPTDNAPARVGPTCPYCHGEGDCGCWCHSPAAQPANTDDRQADTIPGDLKARYDFYVHQRHAGRSSAFIDTEDAIAYIERTGRAETRIEVLEARNAELKDILRGMLELVEHSWSHTRGEQIKAARAALAAPSGE